MKLKSLTLFLGVILTLLLTDVFGQVGIGTSSPDTSSILHLNSNNKGFLPPRMGRYSRLNIASPAIGLLVYQGSGGSPRGFYYYDGDAWVYLGTAEGGAGHVIDADGNSYPTVVIGGQEWMAENLKVTHYRNGDPIPNVTDGATWESLTSGAYCWYGNDSATNAKYGPLYNFYAVDDERELCPFHWHIPDTSEWIFMENILSWYSPEPSGGQMKTASLWNSPNTDATNRSGFSGLPGGYRDEYFHNMGGHGAWWSSTEDGTFSSYFFRLGYNDNVLEMWNNAKWFGFSVRSVRNN